MHDGLVPVLDDLRNLCGRRRGLPQRGSHPNDATGAARRDLEASTVVEARSPWCRRREHVPFGKAGQGKTAAAKAELAELEAFADAQDLDLTTVFFSCEGISSSYTLACGLCEELGGENPNGHPMQKVLDHLWDAMNDIGGTIIIVLDEIDNLGTDDKILYSLPRARDKDYVNDDVYPSIIGISNDLQWRDNLDPAAKDSLYDDSIFLRPTMRTNSAISFPAVQARRSVTPRSCMRHPRARRLRSTSIWMTTMVRLPRPSTK